MKCKVKVGELRDALQMAAITVDRRQGSELGYVHLGSRKGKAGNQRIILNSTDGIGRFLIRVPCEVEETGDLVIEPIRLSSLLDRRQEDELVVFAQDKASNRVVARCGSAKVTMVSAGKSATFESNIKDFPHTAEPTFLIEAVNLKSLLDRTQAFIFKKDGQEHLKNILIRTTKGGYETLATNREVVARAHAEDKNSPGLNGNGAQVTLVEIPGRALPLWPGCSTEIRAGRSA
jgi:DNA polymerase III sliding clamp (beta) subunit (PCNA family)